eukprot:TRINITY_DN3062_c0_g1_i1.p1 TRINITY_DN3062_c0_g1~~TRINITY_DN3062_c0_g1_i1.p1  ORF type:complete len:256 (+),score=59.29 TRINITY_DN3062_c0_g1_i1:53-769(+)
MGGCESAEAPPGAQPPAPPPRPARQAESPAVNIGAPVTGDARVGQFMLRGASGGGMEVLRAEFAIRGGKRCLQVADPEVTCVTYAMNADGDGVLQAFAGIDHCAGWKAELQFINVKEGERVLEVVMDGVRVVQLRITPQGPMAVGYPQPYPPEDSKLVYPQPEPGRPHFFIVAPESVGGDALSTFKQGMFNIATTHEGQQYVCATVRSQLDRSIAVQVVRPMDFAVALAFAIARTGLE